MKNYKYLKVFLLIELFIFVKTNLIYGGCCKRCCCKKNTNSNTGGNPSSEIPLINNPDINNIKQDINNINTDINKIKPDINNIKPDINNIKPDINNIKPDINNIKPNINNINLDINNINNPNHNTESNNNNLKNEINTIKNINTIDKNTHLNGEKIKKQEKKIDEICKSNDAQNIKLETSTKSEKINEIDDTKNINQMNNNKDDNTKNTNIEDTNNNIILENYKINKFNNPTIDKTIENMQNNMPINMPVDNNTMNDMNNINNTMNNNNMNTMNNNNMNTMNNMNNNSNNIKLESYAKPNSNNNFKININNNNTCNNNMNNLYLFPNNLQNNLGNIPNNINNFQQMNLNSQQMQNLNNNMNMNMNMNMYNPQQQLNQQNQMINIMPQQQPQNIINNMQKQNNSNQGIDNPYSLKHFNSVPMIGLVNLGQTCYMNSVLQCFSNLSPITDYFLNPNNIQKVKDHYKSLNIKEDTLLCFAYKDLINKLWTGPQNKPFSPIDFKNRLKKLNPLFADNTAGDSKDFTNYLLMQLHSELNGIEPNPDAKNFPNMDGVVADPYNKKQILNVFLYDFAINNHSIISTFFYGFTEGRFECQGCKMKNLSNGITTPLIKYNYENFFYLEFPLDEVRKDLARRNNMLVNYQNINEVNIYDCFNYYQKLSTIVGYCEKCKRDDVQISSQNLIFSPPPILILIFNRGKGIQYHIKINFPPILNLTNISINYNDKFYELQGVVKHFGDNSASGHFIAYSRTAVPAFKKYWYCFNDQTVVPVNNWNDIVNNGDTYILFYELQNV